MKLPQPLPKHNSTIMKKLFAIAIAALFVISCQKDSKTSNSESTSSTQKASRQEITPPLPDIKPNLYSFAVNALEESVLETPTGSRIIIPANAFVSESGEKITGEVKIEFQEFHDATDVILSGIPMNINAENGEMASLETAGMFKIDGKAGDQKVKIADNKEIEIQLASFKEGNDFNFYAFDETAGNWIEKGRTDPMPNPVKKEALEFLGPDPIKPVAIQKAKSTDQVFELSVNKEENPEFADLDNVLWKTADNSAIPEAAMQGDIRNPRLTCVDADRSVYHLSGYNSQKNSFSVDVTPVLFGSNYEKANKNFSSKMTTYLSKVKSREDEKKRIDMMADLSRSFVISGLGVYNFDRIYHLKRKVSFKSAVFFIPLLKKVFNKAYLLERKNKGAIPYTSNSGWNFMFDPKEDNVLISLDSDGHLYEFTTSDFENGDWDSVDPEKEFSFSMRNTDVVISSSADLRHYIESL